MSEMKDKMQIKVCSGEASTKMNRARMLKGRMRRIKMGKSQ